MSNIEIVTKGNKQYLVNYDEKYVQYIHPTKNIVSRCQVHDKFNKEFGINLCEARVCGNKESERQLIKQQHEKSNRVNIVTKETTELIATNIKQLFNIELPKKQTEQYYYTLTINNNKIILTLNFVGYGLQEKVIVKVSLLDCNGDLRNGIMKAELLAKKELCNKLYNKI